ncbi:phenylacetaldoxime dehydratase [Asaia sp. W19]|uniref:phenylacetaldoxime dehydratase family protein n=1 Tax=unclassified Asaia TaxID=2685023 RepID=UPI000F8D257B|nr:phenylacetaldoxime dehydratase family protein [Asaia sp. W19]RUT25155.1 phenylacetaldoxime dehydratase [Asaia sp. W19]
MESAIAPHLRCPRHDPDFNPRRISDDFLPPFPAWTARDKTKQDQSVMGYFGVQWRDPALEEAADRLLDTLAQRLAGSAVNVERAVFEDGAGYANAVLIGYWPDPQAHAGWWRGQQEWWHERARALGGLGLYREVFLPRSTHLETLFSASDRLEGIGVMLGGRSAEPIQEHGYWGGMRDRLPASQREALAASGGRKIVPIAPGARLVIGHEGLALIRSGQDWSDVVGQELALYRDRIEPTLRAGMMFLRDEGVEIGCYFNRYMQVDETRGGKPCRSFGMSVWRDLASLEHWAEHHPTHKAIFGDFIEVVQALRGVLNLRLFHEVAVLQSDAQIYEYLGCHDHTGMLNGLA